MGFVWLDLGFNRLLNDMSYLSTVSIVIYFIRFLKFIDFLLFKEIYLKGKCYIINTTVNVKVELIL